jgi:hypothetical protein
VRNDSVICDPATGNIGWDTNDPANAGKTEGELHNRDNGTYGNPKRDKKAENKWKYTGICYADHIDSK